MKTSIQTTPETRELNKALEQFDRLTQFRHQNVTDINQLSDTAYTLLAEAHYVDRDELPTWAHIVRVFRNNQHVALGAAW